MGGFTLFFKADCETPSIKKYCLNKLDWNFLISKQYIFKLINLIIICNSLSFMFLIH